jgi:hypothetical protein
MARTEWRGSPSQPADRGRVLRALGVALLSGLAMASVLGALLRFWPNGLLTGSSGSHARLAPTPTPTVVDLRNVIERENALAGTSAWQISSSRAATVEIAGYAGADYVAPGQSITFYISTQHSGDPYRVDVYRIGWYGGTGGRLLTSLAEMGQAQGYYDSTNLALVACKSCIFDWATHLLTANWQPSFSLSIPPTWVTGLYVAKLTTAEGKEAYVHFTVTGNYAADYLATMPDLTTDAYNDWGGYSLYHGPNQLLGSRAFNVSMNRPAQGWRFTLSTLLDAIRWFERNGYDMSYTSNLEISEHPSAVFTHRAYISIGHDEYWTLTMRNSIEKARDSGIGLAFLGADAAYWNVRLEPDNHGEPDRTVVCYKSAVLDPLYGKDNADVTVEWRQAPLLRPENALIGEMYASWTLPPRGWPWYPSYSAADDPLELMSDTGLRPGVSYGCNVVGYEWDHVFYNGATPPGLHTLAISPTVSALGNASWSETVYYVARSGALVFASGSIYFAYALDDLHLWDVPNPQGFPSYYTCLATSRSAAIPGIQILMAHVMFALLFNHHLKPPHSVI